MGKRQGGRGLEQELEGNISSDSRAADMLFSFWASICCPRSTQSGLSRTATQQDAVLAPATQPIWRGLGLGLTLNLQPCLQ